MRAQFSALKITKKNFFKENNTVEFFAACEKNSAETAFPAPFKFRYKGRYAEEMFNKFSINEVVHIDAVPEAYRGKIYGIRGKPIHYPNGKVRKTIKVRFTILGIWKGVKIGRWR